MHLMQYLSHHLSKQTPFSPHGIAPAKGSNAVATRNQRISKDYLREVEHY